MQELEIVIPKEIKISNIVVTADLKQKIDIASFNEYEHLSSNLDLYACGYVQTPTMNGKVTVFGSGKLISIGTKSPEGSIKELKKASKILQKYGLSKSIKITPQLRNIVGKFDLGKKLPIETLARTLPKCMYEPEQFPGLIYPIEGSCTTLLFASGKGVIAGAKTIEELNKALFEIESRI